MLWHYGSSGPTDCDKQRAMSEEQFIAGATLHKAILDNLGYNCIYSTYLVANIHNNN